MLNIVFFAVLLSAALQGPTVHKLAARLRARTEPAPVAVGLAGEGG
jgi:NhaP-type Na+/H+ and K+/H+ antiporter